MSTAGDPRRDDLMAGRIAATLEEAGFAREGLDLVGAAHRLAMEPRRRALSDDHHPDFLHPGRTVLVLLLDTALRDAGALAAAALVESQHPDLRVPDADIRSRLGTEVAARVAAVPLPEAGGLAEALVTADPEVRLVALAERLDHCRHARFWPDRQAQEEIHHQAETVYGPVAERTDERLARRFAHWSGAFARTLAREAGSADRG